MSTLEALPIGGESPLVVEHTVTEIARVLAWDEDATARVMDYFNADDNVTFLDPPIDMLTKTEDLVRVAAVGYEMPDGDSVTLTEEEFITIAFRCGLVDGNLLDRDAVSKKIVDLTSRERVGASRIRGYELTALSKIATIASFKEDGTPKLTAEQQQLADEYINLAAYWADRYSQRSSDMWEDFYGAGLLGLVQAAQNYDGSLGVAKFTTFATSRIRGAILDHIRKFNPGSRRQQELKARSEQVMGLLAQQDSREPSVSQIAEHIDEPVELVESAMGLRRPLLFSELKEEGNSSIDDWLLAASLEEVYEETSLGDLADLIEPMLKPQHRAVLGELLQGKTQKELGEMFGVTESRIGQILKYELVPRLRKANAAFSVVGHVFTQYGSKVIYEVLPPITKSEAKKLKDRKEIASLRYYARSLASFDERYGALDAWLSRLYDGKKPTGITEEEVTRLFLQAADEIDKQVTVRL